MAKRKENVTPEEALYFRNEFREARYATLKSPEEYPRILFAIERFGAYLTDNHDGGLKDYESCIVKFVNRHHSLHKRMPCTRKDYHAKCGTLFRIMMTERNSALHKGSFVKILISHLIELSLMLEDALMTIMADQIKNYMTRNPICAYPWQPISFIRQKMLENSFSYIPVHMEKPGKNKKKWFLISDYAIAEYLRIATQKDDREKLLSRTLKSAVASKPRLLTKKAVIVPPTETVQEALGCAKGRPILVKRKGCPELLGIATPFDLM